MRRWILAAVSGLAMATLAGSIPLLAQGTTCPAGFPINCGNGRCCPANSYCVEGGCVPNGWSYCGRGKTCPPGKTVACPRLGKCYSGAADAQRAGCAFADQVVCGRPVR